MAEDKSTCVVESCDRTIKNKTLRYCDPHYKRHWRYGDVQAHIPVPTPRKAPTAVNDRDGIRECEIHAIELCLTCRSSRTAIGIVADGVLVEIVEIFYPKLSVVAPVDSSVFGFLVG